MGEGFTSSFFFLLFLISLNAFGRDHITEYHAIYISVIEITHESSESSAEIVIKVFTDDMEDALKNVQDKRVRFLHNSDCSSNKPDILAYFSKHFQCSINNQQQILDLESCEITADAVWFTFSIPAPKKWESVQVYADFLMELFPAQSNMIHVRSGDKQQFFRLTSKDKSHLFKFTS
jgi:hypothetical protein